MKKILCVFLVLAIAIVFPTHAFAEDESISIDGFLGDNPLKNAEMALEDDYGMIDGIINNGPKDLPTVAELEAQAKAGQRISLMDLADAIHREKAQQAPKRPSVLDKLKAAKVHSAQTQNNTAPKKSAEMEI